MTSRSRQTGFAPTWPWSPRTPWHGYPSSPHTHTTGARSSNAIRSAMGKPPHVGIRYLYAGVSPVIVKQLIPHQTYIVGLYGFRERGRYAHSTPIQGGCKPLSGAGGIRKRYYPAENAETRVLRTEESVLDTQKEASELQDATQDRKERKRYAQLAYWLAGGWLAAIVVVVGLQGFGLWGFNFRMVGLLHFAVPTPLL